MDAWNRRRDRDAPSKRRDRDRGRPLPKPNICCTNTDKLLRKNGEWRASVEIKEEGRSGRGARRKEDKRKHRCSCLRRVARQRPRFISSLRFCRWCVPPGSVIFTPADAQPPPTRGRRLLVSPQRSGENAPAQQSCHSRGPVLPQGGLLLVVSGPLNGCWQRSQSHGGERISGYKADAAPTFTSLHQDKHTNILQDKRAAKLEKQTFFCVSETEYKQKHDFPSTQTTIFLFRLNIFCLCTSAAIRVSTAQLASIRQRFAFTAN